MRLRWQSFVEEATNRPYLERLSQYLNDQAQPGTSVEVIGMSPSDRDFGRLSEFRCSITAVNNAIIAQEDGCDAFVFGHFQEPGLYEARAACDIPVVGIGEASLLWACQAGRRIGLVSIHPVFTGIHEEQAERYGVSARLAGVTGLGVGVADFTAAFAGDAAAKGELDRQFAEAARTLISSGADVIVIAGGLYSLLIVDEHAPSIDGVPIMSGTPIGLGWAELAVRLHRMTGLTTGAGPLFAGSTDRGREDFRSLLAPPP